MELKENTKLISYTSKYLSFSETDKSTAVVDENKTVEETCMKRFRGIIIACVSGVFISLSFAIVKKINMFSGELGCIRFLSIGIFALPFAIFSGKEFFRNKRLMTLLLICGCLDAFDTYFRFEAVQRLPLADANVIIFCCPAVVTLLARFVLKERCSFFIVLSQMITLMGLILVVKLPLINSEDETIVFVNNYQLVGVAFAVASVFSNATIYILCRIIKTELHNTVILFHMSCTSTIFSLGVTAAFGQFTMPNPATYQPWWLLVIGCLAFIGQLLMTVALQLEHAGPVSIARACSDIVSTFIWEIIFFSDKPSVYSISGALLVTLGGVLMNLSKWVVELPDTSATKKTLKCLTF